MLKFNNISKTYRSKRGTDCDALKGINLTLPEKGLVVVCGKSGSGKSTLLNIVGGLDKPTSGELSFKGNLFSNFKANDLADYRNHIVGFIFQEFNLIENLNVYENIKIPLSLQNQKNKDELINVALKKVGLEGYERRRINELSGGQKQRVAIARVLVKNPQIILADEPTGNLDNKTGVEIFELLKELSKERLVLVVTHDDEKAKAYHDYLIELSDGEVIYNTCPNTEPIAEPIKKTKSALPFSVSAKMGAANVLKKPIRSYSTIVIALLTIFCIAISQFFLLYTRAEAQYRLIRNNDDKTFSISQKDFFATDLERQVDFKYSTLKHIKERNHEIAFLKPNGIISGADDLLKFGFTFLDNNYIELDENSVYVSEQNLEDMYNDVDCCIQNVDGSYSKLLKSEHPPSTMIGKKVKLNLITQESIEFIIAGVVQTKGLGNFYSFYLSSYTNLVTTNLIHFNDYNFILANETYNSVFTDAVIESYEYFEQEGIVVLSDGTLTKRRELNLANNEIILDLKSYNSFFSSSLTIYDYVNVTGGANKEYSLRMLPQHLGSQIDFTLEEKDNGLSVHNNRYKIAGVYLNFNMSTPHIILPVQEFNQVYFEKTNVESLIVKKDTVKNLRKFFIDLEKNNATVDNAYSNKLREVEKEFYKVQNLFIVFSVVLVIIMLLMVINLISASITNRTKELGILKAVGAKNKDLFSIYFFESFILAATVFLLSVAAIFGGAAFLNHEFATGYQLPTSIFYVNHWTILTLLIASFGTIFLATLIPLLKIRKMNPIDAIKTIN